MSLIEDITGLVYKHIPETTSEQADDLTEAIHMHLLDIATDPEEEEPADESMLSAATLVWNKEAYSFDIYTSTNTKLGELSMESIYASINSLVDQLPDGQRLEGINLGNILQNTVGSVMDSTYKNGLEMLNKINGTTEGI